MSYWFSAFTFIMLVLFAFSFLLSSTPIDNGGSFVYVLSSFSICLLTKICQRNFYSTKNAHKSTKNSNFLHIDMETETSLKGKNITLNLPSFERISKTHHRNDVQICSNEWTNRRTESFFYRKRKHWATSMLLECIWNTWTTPSLSLS